MLLHQTLGLLILTDTHMALRSPLYIVTVLHFLPPQYTQGITFPLATEYRRTKRKEGPTSYYKLIGMANDRMGEQLAPWSDPQL